MVNQEKEVIPKTRVLDGFALLLACGVNLPHQAVKADLST